MRFLKFDFLQNFILQLVDGTPLCDTPDDFTGTNLNLNIDMNIWNRHAYTRVTLFVKSYAVE